MLSIRGGATQYGREFCRQRKNSVGAVAPSFAVPVAMWVK
jgi:hypothetical protein